MRDAHCDMMKLEVVNDPALYWTAEAICKIAIAPMRKI